MKFLSQYSADTGCGLNTGKFAFKDTSIANYVILVEAHVGLLVEEAEFRLASFHLVIKLMTNSVK